MFRLLTAFALVATTLATTFEKCSEEEPPPVEVRLSKCTEPPCKLVRGKNVIAEVDFIPDHNITRLKPFAQAIFLGLPINYTLPERNACMSLLNTTCPLAKDEKVTYVLKMPILSIYPPIALKVKHFLIDPSKNQIITCFKIAGQVV